MYDYLIGMSFEDAVSALDERGISYDFGGMSFEDCVRDEDWGIYIGGYWCDIHYEVDFDDYGYVVEVSLWEEGWE